MSKLVFLGDSITDAHHNLGVDEKGLGDGYVSIIDRYLNEKDKKDGKGEKVKVLNRGHDGFTLRGVLHFLNRDCILKSPDVVTILIGCNDVGILMNTGKSLEERNFSEDYDRLLCEIEEYTNATMICMAPFIFPCPQEYENWIPHIRKIEKIEKEVANRHHALFIPLHERLNTEAVELGYEAVTTDGIHLTAQGAKVVADEWMKMYLMQIEG
ncbi:MAG: SGNH/GDSL hydrolase family protein [Lachnospiraceae bacterium]